MSRFLDTDHPAVVDFATRAVEGAKTDTEKAVALFLAVRDGIRYDPYQMSHDPSVYRASHVVEQGVGYCIQKSVLLSAASAAAGVRCQLGFADVRNHLTSKKLQERMKGETLFRWHAYNVFHIDGRQLKATPAFNLELCQKFGIKPLDFDGQSDSLFHPFTADGRQHMEYVLDRGAFDDLPYDEIMADFARYYGVTASGQGIAERDEAFT